jgi:D-threonate/D-erythronate kinase
MANLLILADDFTGAMDTVIQFAKLGIQTEVGTDAASLILSAKHAEVLMVDTETRHMTQEEAYAKVYREARVGREAGIPFLYKKTDSALRGNVGAELSAALAAWGSRSLPFVPAYPVMGRTTKSGIHFINGVPLAQSDFSNDLYSPAQCSDVACLLKEQSKLPVIRDGEIRPDTPFIEVYDAQTDRDLLTIATALHDKNETTILAGCAGLAAVLPDILGLKTGTPVTVRGTGKLLVLCGSMHPVAKEQVRYAVKKGFRHVQLTPAVKLCMEESADAKREIVSRIAGLCREDAPVIVDANDDNGETMAYAGAYGMTPDQVRDAVAGSMGTIGADLMKAGVDSTIFITGGDTLMGFLSAAGNCSLNPVVEILPGVVRAWLEIGDRRLDVITKSGSFGDKRLFLSVADFIGGERSQTV